MSNRIEVVDEEAALNELNDVDAEFESALLPVLSALEGVYQRYPEATHITNMNLRGLMVRHPLSPKKYRA